jgi:hypothetical protein
MLKGFKEEVKVSVAIAPAAGVAATTDIEGAILDMANFEMAVAIVTFGTITGSAVTHIQWEHGDDPALSDAANVAGSKVTIADDDDEKTFVIELRKPRKRYARLLVDRATQNAVVASATYLQLSPRNVPVTHGTGVAAARLVSPATGTP